MGVNWISIKCTVSNTHMHRSERKHVSYLVHPGTVKERNEGVRQWAPFGSPSTRSPPPPTNTQIILFPFQDLFIKLSRLCRKCMFSHPRSWCWFAGRCPHHRSCHTLCRKSNTLNVNQVWMHTCESDVEWGFFLPDGYGAVRVDVFYSLDICVQLRVTVQVSCTAPLQVDSDITH